MDVGLKIVIGADLGDAVQKMAQLTASVTTLAGAATAAGNFSAQLSKIPAALRPINPAGITALSAAVQRLKADIGGASGGGLGALPPLLNKIPPAASGAGASLGGLRNNANIAGQSLIDLGRIAQDAPFGFIAIQNNIQPLFDSFSRLKASTGSTGLALRALGSSLIGVGGIGLAISVATGLLTVFSDKLFSTKSRTDDAADSAKKFADAQVESQVSLQKQVIEVESLVRIARSDISTKAEQANALTRLNELIPDNIGKLDALNIKTAEGVGIIRSYTRALEDQAAAELFINKAADIRGQKFEQLNVFNQKQVDLTLKLQKAQKELAALPSAKSALTPGALEERARIADSIESLNNNLKSNETAFIAERQAFNNRLEKLRSEIDKNVKGGLPVNLPTPPKAKVDNSDELKDAIKNLEAYQQAVGLTSNEFERLLNLRVQLVSRDASKLGLDAGQLAKEINAIRNSNELLESRKKAIDELAKSIGLIQSEKVEALNIDVQIALNDQATGQLDLNQTQRTLDRIAEAANLRLPLTLALDANVQDRIRAAVGELPVIGLPAKVELLDTGLTEARAKIETSLASLGRPLKISATVDKASFNSAESALEQLNKEIKSIEVSTLTNAFVALGEGIGSAIAGGADGLKGVFNGLFKALGSGITQLGEAITQYGVKLLLAKQALNQGIANPALVIAAGIALAALGSFVGTKVTKFAEGGVANKATLGIFGEAGPEAIIPLKQLPNMVKQMMGNTTGSEPIEVIGRISNDVILLAGQRAAKKTGGSNRG